MFTLIPIFLVHSPRVSDNSVNAVAGRISKTKNSGAKYCLCVVSGGGVGRQKDFAIT